MPLLLAGILLLNAGISFWNAKVCGQAWVESKAIGGFVRVLIWCGAIQSAIGFSSVLLFPMAFLVHAMVPKYYPDLYFQATISLWYVTIIIPIVGSGLLITIQSWMVAWRERSLMNLGTAAWNTFAQVHNTMGMIQNMGPALDMIGKAFGSVLESKGGGKNDAQAKLAIIAIMIMVLLVVVALMGGAFLTAWIIQHYAGTVPLPEREEHRRMAARA